MGPAAPPPPSTTLVSRVWGWAGWPGLGSSLPGTGTEACARTDASPESPDHYLVDHRIDGRTLFPATGYLCLVWRTLAHALGENLEQMPVVFEDVTLYQATILPKTGEGGDRSGRVGVLTSDLCC